MGELQDHPLRNTASERCKYILDFHFLAGYYGICQADRYDEKKNPKGYVCLGTALNFLCEDIIKQRLNQEDVLKYTEEHQHYVMSHGETKTREAVANFLTKYFNAHQPVDPENVVLTSGATGALNDLAHVLAEPGETFLMPTPVYSPIRYDLRNRALVNTEEIPLTFQPENGEKPFELTAGKLEKAIIRAQEEGKVVKGLVLVNPNNPTGNILSKKSLMDILDVCKRYSLHVLSDEIYALSTLDANSTFTSILSLQDLPDPQRTHFVYSISKDIGLSSMRIGFIHTTNPVVLRALQVLQLFAQTPSIIHDATAAMLSDTEWLENVYLPTNRQRMREAYEYTKSRLEDMNISFIPAQAGLYVWVDLRKYLRKSSREAEVEFFQEVLAATKVYMVLGTEFFCSEPGWFRIVFTISSQELQEGFDRLKKFLLEKSP